MVLGFASFVCTIGEEAALGGPILSGIGLSGSDRDERDSNLLDISREAVVSNKLSDRLKNFAGQKKKMSDRKKMTKKKKSFVSSLFSTNEQKNLYAYFPFREYQNLMLP